MPSPWSVWQGLVTIAEVLGGAVTFGVVYALYQDLHWALLASTAYLAAGAPIASRLISGLKTERELVENLLGLCKSYERLILGGPSRLAYCISRGDRGIELVCLNATYKIVGFFRGRVVEKQGLPAVPLRRDYTCIRTIRGNFRELEGYKIFKGLALIPTTEGVMAAEVIGAMAEGVEPSSLRERLERLRDVVGELYDRK
jgi:hypothetical protein